MALENTNRPQLATVAPRAIFAKFTRVDSLGKNLVIIGLVIAALGAALWLFGRAGGGLLPGDIVVEKKNVRFYFPVVTCLVVSLVLSAIAWLMRR